MNRPIRRTAAVTLAVAALTLVPQLAAASTIRPAAPSPSSRTQVAIIPSDFVAVIDNPYLPFTPGTRYVYTGTKDGKAARDILIVTSRRKEILGVSCTVLTDRLLLDGKLEETTTAWYAQDKPGNVWYFGEATKVLDANGKVVSTEGSWQAEVDGAQAGIAMKASSKVGDSYRQEYLKGHAEDHAKVISPNASANVPYGSLMGLLETREWTPLEPGVLDHKYYAKRIGVVREIAVRGPKEERPVGSGRDRRPRGPSRPERRQPVGLERLASWSSTTGR